MPRRRDLLKRGTDRWLLETGAITPEQAASAFAGTRAGGREARRRNWLMRRSAPPMAAPPTLEFEGMPQQFGRYQRTTTPMLSKVTPGLMRMPKPITPYELGVEKYGAQPGITPLGRATQEAEIGLQGRRVPEAAAEFRGERRTARLGARAKREELRGARQEREFAAAEQPTKQRVLAAGATTAETTAKLGERKLEPSFQKAEQQSKERADLMKIMETATPGSRLAIITENKLSQLVGGKEGQMGATAEMMQRGAEGRLRQKAAQGVAANAMQTSGLGQMFPDPETGMQNVVMPALEGLQGADLTDEGTEILLEQFIRQLERIMQQADTPEAHEVILNEIKNSDVYSDIVKWQDADQFGSEEQMGGVEGYWARPIKDMSQMAKSAYYQKRYNKVADLARQIVSRVQGVSPEL